MQTTKNQNCSCTKTMLCGIVNVTPDSFSDGGKWNSTESAVQHALSLIKDGADMLDIGGELTRPGSTFVPPAEEVARVVPVIRELKRLTTVPVSIDTWKAEVAQAALEAGADIVNDITGFAGDQDMPRVAAKAPQGVVVMFNPVIYRPNHESCKIFPQFNLNASNEKFLTEAEKMQMQQMQILDAMRFYLNCSILLARNAGIPGNKILLDPGIGFGLTKKENLTLIKNIDVLHDMGFQIFLGVSRKRFVVNVISEANIDADATTDLGFRNRDYASAILTAIATQHCVEVVRTHAITEHKIAREVINAVKYAEASDDTNFASYTNNKNKNGVNK